MPPLSSKQRVAVQKVPVQFVAPALVAGIPIGSAHRFGMAGTKPGHDGVQAVRVSNTEIAMLNVGRIGEFD
jgi:hypothetical protein